MRWARTKEGGDAKDIGRKEKENPTLWGPSSLEMAPGSSGQRLVETRGAGHLLEGLRVMFPLHGADFAPQLSSGGHSPEASPLQGWGRSPSCVLLTRRPLFSGSTPNPLWGQRHPVPQVSCFATGLCTFISPSHLPQAYPLLLSHNPSLGSIHILREYM